MDDDFFDHDNIMDDDPALDYILYEDMEKNPPKKGGGCLSVIVIFLLPFSTMALLLARSISPEISPLEAGLAWITKLDKGDFIGRKPLLKMRKTGVPHRLVALRMIGAGVPREQYPIYADDKEIGIVTSGTMSPMLKVGIALALVAPGYHTIGTELSVGIRKRKVAIEVVKAPFV